MISISKLLRLTHKIGIFFLVSIFLRNSFIMLSLHKELNIVVTLHTESIHSGTILNMLRNVELIQPV